MILFFCEKRKDGIKNWEIMKRITDLIPGVRGIDFLLQLITVLFFRSERKAVSSFVITSNVQGPRLSNDLTICFLVSDGGDNVWPLYPIICKTKRCDDSPSQCLNIQPLVVISLVSTKITWFSDHFHFRQKSVI
jgi:hypothetical protein